MAWHEVSSQEFYQHVQTQAEACLLRSERSGTLGSNPGCLGRSIFISESGLLQIAKEGDWLTNGIAAEGELKMEFLSTEKNVL